MPKQDVNVKSYVRKGKLVKQYKRKQDRKNNTLLNTAKVIGGALGISAVTYLVLRKRYVNNLNAIANNLKANPNIGEKLADEVKDITFTIGGLTGDATKKNTDPFSQARYMSAYLNNHLSSKDKKLHKVVALQHSFNTDNLKSKFVNISERFKLLSEPLFKGKNDDAIKLAEEIYSYHVKNPKKLINIFGFSAGSNLGRDIEYILSKKSVKIKLATIGSANFKLTPSKKSLNFVGTNDYVKYVKSNNAIMIPNAEHHPEPYMKSEIVTKGLFNFFYKQNPYYK